MKSVKLSLEAFGIYLMVLPGLGLMLFPAAMLDLFSLTHHNMIWMARLIGMTAFIIGILDFLIGYYEIRPLYRWTVGLRYFAAIFMLSLWANDEVEATIILFASMDFLGAVWSTVALKLEPPRP